MSDNEEEDFSFYGKPLELYSEEDFPKKKPISIEDQVARDAQGRRRFHGAFTGGFSAGFFNTVGSLEGWTPSEFKSTRSDKTESKKQLPEDFMDDEDMGEFGIAPQKVQPTKDYSNKKRKRNFVSSGPIPGVPVLQTLLESGNETIGYYLIKNMKMKGKKDTSQSVVEQKVYGCEMPKNVEDPDVTEEITWDLDKMYLQYLKSPKINSFGLGYAGLNPNHVNLFEAAHLTMREKNKKVSISGQAFGVGAFEEDDDDIYVKEDMSKYDYELTSERSSKKKETEKQKQALLFDLFVDVKHKLQFRDHYAPPTIPASFSGIHKVKKSRFEPVPEKATPQKREINAITRAQYLGEEIPSNKEELKQAATETSKPDLSKTKPEKKQSASWSNQLMFDKFVSASQPEDVTNILEPVKRMETEHGTKDMREAAKLKMFGPLTRTTSSWQPCAILCRRFNVPEPNSDSFQEKTKKRTKNLIFEYQKQTEPALVKEGGLIKPNETVNQEENNPPTPIFTETEPNVVKDPVTETQPEPQPPVTKPLDITDKINVSENVDLFKAVFLSSSESEDEEETMEDSAKKDEIIKAAVLSESFIPEIKPVKEGILSNLDLSIFAKSAKTPEGANAAVKHTVKELPESVYGPKLPESLPIMKTSALAQTSNAVDGEWVEKDETEQQYKYKHKKKKDKEKHKKHKHKSKHKKKHR